MEILIPKVERWIFSFTCFSRENKHPQNNFSCQKFSVENAYFCVIVLLGFPPLETEMFRILKYLVIYYTVILMKKHNQDMTPNFP